MASEPDNRMSKTVSLEMFTLNASESTLAFYARHTGIQDQDKLKEHIVGVAQGAIQIFPYHCIRTFGFLRFRIIRCEPGYKQLLKLGFTRQNALFLDLGCCFGSDIRKAIEDGFPAENIVASDLQPEFWQFGHDLFKSNASTLPATFIPGDVLDPSFISTQPPIKSPHSVVDLSLQSLLEVEPRSLNPLRGHLSAIHTSAFFHLFSKDKQIIVARKLASLLSALPGSIIFGCQTGSQIPHEVMKRGEPIYDHSPESWKRMWTEEVFENSDATVFQVEGWLGNERDENLLFWTVTRL